jgi:hypothetical protein
MADIQRIKVEPVRPYIPDVRVKPVYPLMKDWSDRNPYDDPYKINSLSDVIFNIEGLRRSTGKEFAPVLSNLEGLVHYINDSYLQPLRRGEFSTAFVNSLNALGEDVDLLANPIKGMVLEQDDPTKQMLAGATGAVVLGAATLATGGGILPALGASFAGFGTAAAGSALIEDPDKALQGAIKGMGIGQTGKHNYYADSGNFLKDLAFEIAIDPFNWVSMGLGAFKGAKINRTAAKVADTFDLNSKSIAQGIRLLSKDTSSTTLSKYVKTVLGEGQFPEVMKLLNEEMAWETVKAVDKLIAKSESVEKFILKSSFTMTPFGGARLLYKYGNKAGQFIGNRVIMTGEKYKVPIKQVDIFEVDNMITEIKTDLKVKSQTMFRPEKFDFSKAQYEVGVTNKIPKHMGDVAKMSEREKKYILSWLGGPSRPVSFNIKEIEKMYDLIADYSIKDIAEGEIRKELEELVHEIGWRLEEKEEIVNQLVTFVQLRRDTLDSVVDSLTDKFKVFEGILEDAHKSFDIKDYNKITNSASQARFLHYQNEFNKYFEGKDLKKTWDDVQKVLENSENVNKEAVELALKVDERLRYVFSHFNLITDDDIYKALNGDMSMIRYSQPERMSSKVAKDIKSYIKKVEGIDEDIMGPLDLTRLDDYIKENEYFLNELEDIRGWLTEVNPYNFGLVMNQNNKDVRKLIDLLYDLQDVKKGDYKRQFDVIHQLKEQVEMMANYSEGLPKEGLKKAFKKVAPFIYNEDYGLSLAEMIIGFIDTRINMNGVIDDAFDYIIESVGSDRVYKLMMNKRTSRLTILAGLTEETYKSFEDILDPTTDVGAFFKLIKTLDDPKDAGLKILKNLIEPVYKRTQSTLNYVELFSKLSSKLDESSVKVILTNLENKARLDPYSLLDDLDNFIKDIIKQKATLADNLGIEDAVIDSAYLKGILYEYLAKQGQANVRVIDTVDGYYGRQFEEIGNRLAQIMERLNTGSAFTDLDIAEFKRLTSGIFAKDGTSPIFENIKDELTNIKQINNSLSYGFISPEELKKVTNQNAYDFVNNSHRWAVQTIYRDPMFPKIWEDLGLSRISSHKLDEMFRGIIEELYKFADQSTQTTEDFFKLHWAKGLKEIQEIRYSIPSELAKVFLEEGLEVPHKVALLRLIKKYDGFKHVFKNPDYVKFRGLFPKVDILQKRLDEVMQSKYELYQFKDMVTDPSSSKYVDREDIQNIVRRINLDDEELMNELIDTIKGWAEAPHHDPQSIASISGKMRRYISENIGQLEQLKEMVTEVNFLKEKVDYNFDRNFSRNVYTKKLSTLFSLDAADTARLIKNYTPGFIVINRTGVLDEYLDKFLDGLRKTGLSDYGLAIKKTDDMVWVYKDQNLVSESYKALDSFDSKIKLDLGKRDERLNDITEILEERMKILEMQSGSAIKEGDPIIYPFDVDATDPNILYDTNVKELIEKMPKSVKESFEVVEDFPSGHLLNHVTFGTIKGYKDIHPYVSSNYFKGLIDSSSSLAKTAKAKVKYIELFFKDDYSVRSFRGMLSYEQMYNVIKENKRQLKAGVLVDVNGKPRMKEFFINSPRDVKMAERMGATILPTSVFNTAYKDINNYKSFIQKVPLLNVFNKFITNTYRTLFLMTSGFVSRNLMDTIFKNTAEYSSIADMPKAIQNMYSGFAAYKFYSEVQADIITKGKGVFNKNTSLLVLRELTPEERSLYILIDSIVSSPAADTQIGEYAKLIREYNMEQADVDVDMVSKLQFQNPVSRRIFEANSYVELSARIGMVFDEIAKTMNPESGINKAIMAHFDYSAKTLAATYAELIIPFLTFPLRNLSYWVDKAVEIPHIMKLLLDMQNVSWNSDEDYSYYADVERYKSVQYHTTSGNLRFGSLVMKLNPSFYDAANLLVRPQDELMNRLLPPVKYGVEKMMGQNPDLSNIAPWAGTARNMSKILHGDPYNEGERGLHTQIPSLFSTIYTHTPWNYNNYKYDYYSYNPSTYYPRTYLPYNFYQRLYSKAGNPRKDLRMSVATPQNLAYKIYDIQARIR